MKFTEIVSISGVPGLKRVIAQRPDGLIVSDLDGTNKKFMTSRRFLFSPLESISIYTYEDSTPVFDIFLKMKEVEIVDPKSDATALRSFMESVLPEYDEDRVHVSDIKKLVKWFIILNEFDLIQAPESTEEDAEESAE